MTLRLRAQFATVLLVVLGAIAWADDAPTKGVRHPLNDRSGDPLPPGATMRLGTVRFRQAPFIKHIVYSPDGQSVITDNESRQLQIWDARDGKNLPRSMSGSRPSEERRTHSSLVCGPCNRARSEAFQER